MAFWLASARGGAETDWIQRFDPRFWTVNFPRPMMAAVTTPAPDALRVDATFLTQGDLAGLIWESEDRFDHPLLAYTADRDYSGTTLSFHWRSGGIVTLDEVNGPTLTIEGRDAAGEARTWYVRLWNYASGSPTEADISLDFANLLSGYTAGTGETVYPGAIDRLFISMVALGFSGGSTAPLPVSVDGWIELTGIHCTGNQALLRIGNAFVPPNGLAIATDYDDCCVQTPARLVRNLRQLGYRGSVLHYVGMSHHFRLAAQSGQFQVATDGAVLCTPASAWHAAFFAECAKAGLSPITSMSYEVLASYCPPDWQQRAANGDPALTGYSPPSTLLSPANATAMGWLQSAAAAFVGLMKAAGVPVRFQVGEPWWWVMADGRICLYDDAARAVFGGSPVAIADIRQGLDSAQTALLDQAGACLASSTAALVAAVRSAAAPASVEALLLTFLPGVLDPEAPEARRANLPVGWAVPAFDRLQLEDYDWLTAGADALRYAAYDTVEQRLGYAPAALDYLAGYVPNAELSGEWRRIDGGVDEAQGRGVHEVIVWSLTQVCRDGYLRIPPPQEVDEMLAFDNVPYPLALSLDTKVSPEFSTNIATTASGFERRNSLWANPRLVFDVGPGIRSDRDIGVLLAFFRARRGPARGFLLPDPTDFSSNGMTDVPGPTDQMLGTGDGTRADFPLVKVYGEAGGDGDSVQTRRITRPRAGSVSVSVNGVTVTNGWTLEDGGVVRFDTAPAAGAVVRAGFLFDVPVRFQQDRLDLTGYTFAAGEAPSVPLIELREAV